ncbi:MAG TPA: hypothetical protein VFJ82_23085 [Longimicrobium sp.]|nr:hypothetical protein [Longimicrobium sp.]
MTDPARAGRVRPPSRHPDPARHRLPATTGGDRRFTRRFAMVLGCALLLGGCVTWREQPAPLPTVRRTLDGPVRITRHDGSSVLLDGADERGDSIIGHLKANDRRVAIPVDEVARVQQHRANVLGTLALVTLAAAAAFAAYAYSVFNDPNY